VLTTPNIASLRAVAAILNGRHPGFFATYLKPEKLAKEISAQSGIHRSGSLSAAALRRFRHHTARNRTVSRKAGTRTGLGEGFAEEASNSTPSIGATALTLWERKPAPSANAGRTGCTAHDVSLGESLAGGFA
jgi:hypothetical protein